MKYISKFNSFLNEDNSSKSEERNPILDRELGFPIGNMDKNYIYELKQFVASDDLEGLKDYLKENNLQPTCGYGTILLNAVKNRSMKILKFLIDSIHDEKFFKSRYFMYYRMGLYNPDTDKALDDNRAFKLLTRKYPLSETEIENMMKYIKKYHLLDDSEIEKITSVIENQ